MTKLFLLATSALMLATSASAEVTIDDFKGVFVMVYRDLPSAIEVNKLTFAGVTEVALYVPLLSCVVPGLTSVIVLKKGYPLTEVRVIDGKDRGCGGLVANFNLPKLVVK